MRTLSRCLLVATLTLLPLALAGCEEDDPAETPPPSSQAGSAGSAGSSAGSGGSAGSAAGSGGSGSGGSAGSAGASGEGGSAGAAGAPACAPLPDDYQPRVNGSKGDTWPACVSDSNTYTPVDPGISTLARVAAFESIASRLGFGTGKAPSMQEFLDALSDYTTPEGLESRVTRREDEHYPASAKACKDMTPDELAQSADRCVGPARIAPLLKKAFEDGVKGLEPQLNAARIEAALLWFFYVSIYKEATTCSSAPKDCDSSLAYYAGSTARDEAKGLARYVQKLDAETHDRVFDGSLAVRCWRDLDKSTDGKDLEPDLHKRALAQLDRASLRGVALVVEQLAASAGASAAAFEQLTILGPVLLREARLRDAARAAALEAQLAKAAGPEVDAKAVSDALGSLFACP